MSYIQQREKIFIRKGGLSLLAAIKLKTPGRLKNASPFTDPRAWSLDRNSQRKYFLDSIARNTYNGSSSSSDENLEYTPPKKRRNSSATKTPKRKLHARRALSAEQLKCITSQPDKPEVRLAEANAEINWLNSQKEQLEKASEEYQVEIDNLRSLVAEVQEELCFLNDLKDENIKLRAELKGDIHKQVSDAEEEINHLNSQLEIYKEYKLKYENLRSCNEELRDEHDQIRVLLKELEWNNTQLQSEIESLKSKVSTLESRELAISNAAVDKEVLRERLLMREEKIVSLVSFLEEKELTIQELVVQLQHLTSSVVAKEGATGRHINALKLALNEKIAKIEELEDRLHASELFIRELENIRDHFRLSNCALTENMQNYKKQFNTIVSSSKKLLSQLEIYKLEIEDKDLLIRKLSIFPQSASSIVHFAQLLNILKSTEEMIHTDEQGAISFIPTMRRIVEQLKGEIIGDRIEYPLYEIHNSHSQTDFKGINKCIQNELFYIEHKSVEASLPDKYFFAYERSQTEIADLNAIIESLKESFLRVDSANHSLERKIITFLAERRTKEIEMNSLREQLATACKEMKYLRNELDSNNSLLNKSLSELDVEKELRESTSEMFVATLDSTTYEYNMYVKVLESLLIYKDEKIKCLEDYLCNEPQKDESVENEHITLLENELKHLSAKYLKEKQTIKTLNVQVSKLQAALTEKMDHFKIVQEKLLRAEKIFEHLNNIESQCLLKGSHEEGLAVLPTEDIVVTASDKILSHSERLESHLKEEKNIKEKLLRDTVSREYVSNLMQRNTSQKKNLKKIISQLKSNISRVKFALLKLRNKLKLSEKMNHQFSAELSKMNTYNTEMKKEVDYMKDQLEMEKSKNKNLDIALEMKTLEQYDQRNKTKKVVCVLGRIIKQLQRKGRFNGVSTQTDLPFRDKEKEISNLKTEIKELKNENDSLIGEVENMKERLASILYVPHKEPQTLSTNTQTDDDNTLNDVRNHYENIILILQKDKALEKEGDEKRFKNIVHKLTEAYEKDLNDKESLHDMELEKLKKIHKEKCMDHIKKYELEEALQLEIAKQKSYLEALLANKQSLYDMELEKIKISHQEKCKDHINKNELEEALLEMEKQKSHYEALLKSKQIEEDELNKEIRELKEEVGKIIAQKQKEDRSFNEKIEMQLINLKTKFKKHYKRLKKAHEAELLQLNNKHNEAMEKINAENIENVVRNNLRLIDAYCQTEIDDDIKLNADCQTEAFDEERLNNNLFNPQFEQLNNFETSKEDNNKESLSHNTNATNNKRIDINLRERVKCSFKEANGMIPKDIFNILNAMRPSTKILNSALNLCLKDRTVQSPKKQTVSDICGSLINSTNIMEADCQDMLKTLSMFEKCATKEKAIIEDIRDISNMRSNNYSSLQQSLDLEFERAEKLRNQRDELSNEVFRLKKQLADLDANLNFEKNKNENLNRLISSMKMQRRNSEKLEMSLERLRTKLERAELCEKRLSEELEEDKKTSERIQVVIESNKIEPMVKSISTVEKNEVAQSADVSDESNSAKCSEVTKDVEGVQSAIEHTDEIQSDNKFVKRAN